MARDARSRRKPSCGYLRHIYTHKTHVQMVYRMHVAHRQTFERRVERASGTVKTHIRHIIGIYTRNIHTHTYGMQIYILYRSSLNIHPVYAIRIHAGTRKTTTHTSHASIIHARRHTYVLMKQKKEREENHIYATLTHTDITNV